MEWYYALNNQQQGPVSEADLRGMAQAGVIQPDTLVWRQGMADWQPYGQVVGGAPASPVAGAYAEIPSRMDQYMPRESSGTGGQTPNSELRAMARQALSGGWGPAVGFIVVLWLIHFGVNMASGILPIVGVFVPIVLAGPFTLGMMTNYLNVSRGGETDFANLFSGFQDFGRALGVYFLILLMAFVVIFIGAFVVVAAMGVTGGISEARFQEADGVLLAIIFIAVALCVASGFYIQLKFSQVYYIMADHRDMGVIEVLSTSSQMMKGQLLKLFFLYLSFIGWAFLAIFTFFIGYIFLVPYMMVAQAKFYDDIR
ncbi:DUF975 family protein [Cerasicoccus arenae]|uniref:GYF domain-containing protein n=1 Tax=Cerasicoccus arenae TaxID=424488 RepID=A0A8J3DDC7_9BACT|nr:DUF975 family protein [Cerasicoccus arenae]MBK1857171.1 DUF975 family protein [Cerasicoccus arenae]GHB92766.1 hypothetical protein GCM10007047_05020 [Cerasicoccus arenae]